MSITHTGTSSLHAPLSKGVDSFLKNISTSVYSVPELSKSDTSFLEKIAKEVYGASGNYMTIFEANKPMLSDPDKIYPGQVLRIPKP